MGMDWWAKQLPCKPDDWSLIPGIRVQKENSRIHQQASAIPALYGYVRGRGRRIVWKFLGWLAWSMLRGRKNRNSISTSGR